MCLFVPFMASSCVITNDYVAQCHQEIISNDIIHPETNTNFLPDIPKHLTAENIKNDVTDEDKTRGKILFAHCIEKIKNKFFPFSLPIHNGYYSSSVLNQVIIKLKTAGYDVEFGYQKRQNSGSLYMVVSNPLIGMKYQHGYDDFVNFSSY